MSLFAWIVFGLIAGFIASKIVNRTGQGSVLLDIVLGVVGAVLGGSLFTTFGMAGVTGFQSLQRVRRRRRRSLAVGGVPRRLSQCALRRVQRRCRW